jgi:phosphoadenosine phosphosulfate reductase
MPNFDALNLEYASKRPKDVLKYALDQHEQIAISFSGAEDVVLIDMAVKIRPDIDIFTLDTGRLNPETYQFIEKVRKHYGITLDVRTPEQTALQNFVKEKGLFSFYQDGHSECCNVRKIEPLRQKLRTLDAWITGQRRDQSPGTRSNIQHFEQDSAFKGRGDTLFKYNPLALWTGAQVWEYIKMFDVPYNSLHEKGYVSIGCEPCTRAVLPHQHEREGRWWWENQTKKECGLHAGNLIHTQK